jgi:hypothetical protein
MTEAEAHAYLNQAEQKLAHMPDAPDESSRFELMSISAKIGEIAKKYPDMPQVWTVAATAIDKHLGASMATPRSPACGTEPTTAIRPSLQTAPRR